MTARRPLTDPRAAHQIFEIAEPKAASLIESLRAFGYDLPTAVADLIDNSITAKAKNVWLTFEWRGRHSRIVIRDDGHGMSEDELSNAMRPGSFSPLECRNEDDLGRFGLGLKTASFSQCRRTTVISKREERAIAVRCWDLDYVSSSEEWRLLKGIDLADKDLVKQLDSQEGGTIIVWEKLDRLVGDASTDDPKSTRHWLERLEKVKDHLSMVFHRFLVGRDALDIHFNERPVEPWDPFLSNEKATEQLPKEVLRLEGASVVVQPYILPHSSKIAPDTHRRGGGFEGWNASQGFYVYRNRRMLVAGDWLGLGFQKEEHHKLARILVDLPNRLDHAWNIDVRKARAKPPAPMRDDLKRIARVTRQRAAEVYRHRGKVITRQQAGEQLFVWEKKVKHGKIFYKINQCHPLVETLLKRASDYGDDLRALFTLIEQTIPVDYIVLNNSEQPDSHGGPFDDVSTSTIERVAKAVYNSLLEKGYRPPDALIRLLAMEPFHRCPEIIVGLLEELNTCST